MDPEPAVTPPTPAKPFPIFLALLSLLLLLSTSYLAYQNTQLTKQIAVLQTQTTPTPLTSPTPDPTANWKMYTFQPIQLTLKVPNELTVESSSPNGNDFTGYIQNSTFNSGKLDGSYQLYIVWQPMPVTELEFKNSKFELEPTSVEELAIDGYPAIQGQIKGERNRFVTYILWKKTKMSLYTSEATQKNKVLTDQILSTFKFIENADSQTQAVNLPFYRPNDWSLWGNSTLTFSFAYDAGKYLDPSGTENNIVLLSTSLYNPNPFNIFIRTITYDSKSKNSFISSNVSYTRNTSSYEKIYTIRGKPAIFIYNVNATDICSVGAVFPYSKQALLVTSQSCTHADLEPILSTFSFTN